MENYGTDKPDLRFGSPIIDLTEAMRHSALESFASKVPLEECVMKLVTITAAEDEGDDLPSITQVGSFADKLGFFEGFLIQSSENLSVVKKPFNVGEFFEKSINYWSF